MKPSGIKPTNDKIKRDKAIIGVSSAEMMQYVSDIISQFINESYKVEDAKGKAKKMLIAGILINDLLPLIEVNSHPCIAASLSIYEQYRKHRKDATHEEEVTNE